MDLLLHDIPEAVDRALRARAEATEATVDAVAVAALGRALGVPLTADPNPLPPGPPYHDLDWLAGSDPLEQAVIDAIAKADVTHPDDWK